MTTLSIAHQAHGTKTDFTATVNTPLGAAPGVGNQVSLVVMSGVNIAAPAGWVQREADGVAGNMTILDRVVDGTQPGDSNGAYSFPMADFCSWHIVEWHADVAGTWSYDGHGDIAHSYPSSLTGLPLAPGTTGGNDTVAVFGVGAQSAITAVTVTPPTGGALALDVNNQVAGSYTLSTTHKIVDGATFAYSNTAVGWTTGSASAHAACAIYRFTPSAAANDFSISSAPASITAQRSSTPTSLISTALVSGVSETVALTVTGQPSGVTTALSAASIPSGGGTSTVTITVGPAVALGTYTLTVTAVGASATHTTTITLIVAANNFALAANPTLVTTPTGSIVTSAISTSLVAGASETVALTVTGQPAGVTATVSPASVPAAGGLSTLTVTVDPAAATPGTYTLTVTGTAASATHTATVTVVIVAASVSSSGLGIPFGYPHGYGTSTPSENDAVNRGNVATPPLITIHNPGAITNPLIRNKQTGEEIRLALNRNGPPSDIVIDCDAGTVTENGDDIADAIDWTITSFFWLQPGVTTIQLAGDGVVGATATVQWHDAFVF